MKLLFPHYCNNTLSKEHGILFKPAAQCKICKRNDSTPCTTINGFSICKYGYTVYKLEDPAVTFFGIKIKGHVLSNKYRKNFKDDRVPIIEKANFLNSITPLLEVEREKAIIRKYLHDLGQYTGGLSEMIPMGIPKRGTMNVSAIDLGSIEAFTKAMITLRKQASQQILNEGVSTKIVSFNPYQLFDKFRLCFAASDISIKLKVENKERYTQRIRTNDGFDLVVLNILANACKYLPRKNKHRNIDIIFQHSEDEVKITVSSYGPPVEPCEIASLGKLGFRSANVISRGIDGQGLGLYMIKEYGNKAGIDISFNSDPKQTVGLSYKTSQRFEVIMKISEKIFC